MANSDDEAFLIHTSDENYDSDNEAPQQRVRRRPRVFNERRNFDVIDFKERFRLTRQQVEYLVSTIEQHLQHGTNCNKAVTSRQQVLIALRFFADGAALRLIGDAHGISKATVSRCIHRVANAIVNSLFDENVNFPTNEESVSLPLQFQQVTHSRMPSVCGCIDGTHIPIIAPYLNESQFVNRHDVHSLNCMLVCGPNLKIYYCSSRWPGSVHDSRVLRNSTLATRFNDGWRPFRRAILIGDSGYGGSDWLITPLMTTHNNAEEAFNRHHKRMRRLIENCNGLLKERFRCLKFLHFQPTAAATIVKACVTLHNLILSMQPAELQLNEDDVQEVHQPQENHPLVDIRVNTRRLELIMHFENN